jgi:hypothetical protein
LSVKLRHLSLSSEQSNRTFWPLALEGGRAADHSQKLSSTTSRRLQGSGTQARELRPTFVNNGSDGAVTPVAEVAAFA